MNQSIALWCVVFICGTCGSAFGRVPAPIHGATVDNVGNLLGIVTSYGGN